MGSMSRAEDQPVLRIRSPFWLGNHYTLIELGEYAEGYNYEFGTVSGPNKYLNRQTNLDAARNILVSNPQVNKSLEYEGDRHYDRYRFFREGSFDISWSVATQVQENRMVVDYSTRIVRPDSSLIFVLSEQQDAEFFDSRRGSYKRRTRIDGLPVFIRVDELQSGRHSFGTGLPSTVTLFRKGLPEQRIPFEDGAAASLQGTDRLVGTWDENWTFNKRLERGINGYKVELRGYWDK